MRNLRTLGIIVVALLGAAGCSSTVEDVGEVTSSGGEIESASERDALDVEETSSREDPRFDAIFADAGREFAVPPAVLKSIAFAETRYEMVAGEEELDGKPPSFGMMALSGARLEQGAKLAGVTVEQAKSDPRSNVRAAAALLSSHAASMGIARERIAAWAQPVARFSGIDDQDARTSYARDEVFGALERGVGELSVQIPREGLLEELRAELPAATETLAAGPDYASAIWRPSPNFNSRPVKAAMVIVHTCESGYSGCWSWLTQTRSQVSAHYVVREDGREISQLVREASRAWHIGATYSSANNGGVDAFRNGTSCNNFTIGIEHGGYASQKSWPTAQIDASAKLVCDISRDNGIPRDRFHVVGHGQLQPYNRTDPGANWPWADYMKRINTHCGATQPPPPPPPPSGGELIIDSNNARNDRSRGYIQVSGNWKSSVSVLGYYGTGYWSADAAAVSDGATFYVHATSDVTKTIDAYWTAASDRTAAAPFVVFNARGEKVGQTNVDQRSGGSKWNTIGTFRLTAGWNRVVLSRWTTTGTVVIADAIRVR
jgi:hypothetical protein